MEPPQPQKSPSVGAAPRRMRKVVTQQMAINLQETRVRTLLLPPVCVKQAGPWWGQELYGTQGRENVPECTETSATLIPAPFAIRFSPFQEKAAKGDPESLLLPNQRPSSYMLASSAATTWLITTHIRFAHVCNKRRPDT